MKRMALILLLVAGTSACHSRSRTASTASVPTVTPPEVAASPVRGPGAVLDPDNGSSVQGVASYYGDPYNGRQTANGETFDKNKLTAAHRTLPFGTWVRVENESNGRTVDVRINDRGPFVAGRTIDLSEGAARRIEMLQAGVVPVRLTVIQESPNPETARPAQEVFYAVQVGAFREERAAQELRRDLERRYTGIYVDRPSDDSPLYKVRIGRALLTDARDLQLMIREREQIEAIVVQMHAE